MKYTQYSERKKGSSAFYIVIALCLVLVGVAAWFAFTRMETSTNNNTASMESQFQNNVSEYQSNLGSYNNSTSEDLTIPSFDQPTNDNVSDQEYTEPKKPVKIKSYTMPVNGDILKDFDTKTLQYSATYGDMRIHAAVDIACVDSTLVSAVTDGKIQNIEQTADYGKCVTIDHGDGLVIKYCGLKNITVKKDTPIKMGDHIGAVSTVPCESSDQIHIHLEAYENGKAVSLLKFFKK